jgi:hypothetical protein
VDTAKIVERIGQMIFGDIYTQKKYRYGKYDFPFDEMVDSTSIGAVTGGMTLRFLTVAADPDGQAGTASDDGVQGQEHDHCACGYAIL